MPFGRMLVAGRGARLARLLTACAMLMLVGMLRTLSRAGAAEVGAQGAEVTMVHGTPRQRI